MGDSPSTSRTPAGISSISARIDCRSWRTSTTSSPSNATIAAAPGWRTISRSPSGQSSTTTRIRRPRKASRDEDGSSGTLAGDDDRVVLGGSRPTTVERRADEVPEQWVRPGRPGLELGVELAGHEEGVIRQFDDLDEPAVRGVPGDDHPGLLERAAVHRI